MRLINQSYEILGTPKSLDEAWAFTAMAARNCYQSEKTKLDESEEDFCRRILIKHPDDHECDHMSPLEFGIVYLTIPTNCKLENERFIFDIISKYENNPYSRSKVIWNNYDTYYITTNLRVIIENGWEDDLKYAGSPTEHHVKACAFHLITNRAIMCELTRHEAALSFTCESTRYCNYGKDKFGNELTFIKPCWVHELEVGKYSEGKVLTDLGVKYINAPKAIKLLLFKLQGVELDYLDLIKEGWTPQQAATILPNALKVSIMMCGYEDSLQHVFRLRAEECSGPVHPQMAELMKPLYEDYKNFNE